jgi:hypothetical protein
MEQRTCSFCREFTVLYGILTDGRVQCYSCLQYVLDLVKGK